jgi:outer membrane protein assembly factor BamB
MYRAPVVENRELLIVAGANRILAYRRTDGAVVWAYDLEAGNADWADSPLPVEFVEDRVFVARCDTLFCLEYATGRLLGQVTLPDAARRPQLLVDGTDVFVYGRSTVMCLDVGGRVRWQGPHGIALQGSATLALPGNVRAGDGFGNR